jgi:predicted nucleic acid-binding protein
MARYYIDACIWRDYFEDRRDNLKPLGEWAFRFLKQIVEKEDTVILSNILIRELRQEYSQEEVENILVIIPEKLKITVELDDYQKKDAIRIQQMFGIHLSDASHIAIAKAHEAIIITRDKHFDNLKRKLIIRKPEELL